MLIFIVSLVLILSLVKWNVTPFLGDFGGQQYSRDLKSDHSKTGFIRNPDILEVVFRMVRFSNGRDHSYRVMFLTIQKPDYLVSLNHFIHKNNYSGFQMVECRLAYK